MTQSNPLVKHFRQPAIFLKLPSQGKFWADETITLPVSGELPVYPMTTRDEITLRTPDALINGTGVVSVIESCIPSINNAWAMPSIDVDACLIAIRIASYGNDMNVTTTCPNCASVSDHTIDLNDALARIQAPEFKEFTLSNGLVVRLKPQNYFAVNKTNSISYEEQRIINILNQSNMSVEDKETNLREITDKLIELNVETLSNSTDYIQLEDGTRVDEPEYLKEFYANTSSGLIKEVQNRLGDLIQSSGLRPFDNECDECGHKFKTDVTFDYASFFANGS